MPFNSEFILLEPGSYSPMIPTALGPHVYLFPTTVSEVDQELLVQGQQPSLVLLLGWFSAAMSLLSKYVEMHRTLYPAADIVLVETPTPIFPLSDSEKERELYLTPVIELLINQIYSTDNRNRGLLVHLFSNAGGLQLKTISAMLLQKSKPHSQETLSRKNTFAFVIDSSPGTEEYKALLNALAAYVKSSVVKTGAQIPLWMIVYSYYFVNIKILRNHLLLPPMREYMEQPSLLPGSGMRSPRLYIYSDSDDVVSAPSVEHHLSKVLEKQIPFQAEKFIGSPHVSHMPQDPKRYRKAIADLWIRASKEARTERWRDSKL